MHSTLWNGSNDSIFRISSQICAGYEICLEFVNMVMKIKCNFAAYCDIMSTRYKYRNIYSKPFMSPKSYRKLFFSWASHQRIDFRSACHWCGSTPKVLACDATKIGIISKNLKIKPVEETSNSIPLPTISRRFDRCFLQYPPADSPITAVQRKNAETEIKECRIHMKLVMSTSTGFIEQSCLSSEQLIARNSTMLNCFPDPCKPLLLRLLELEVSEEQRRVTSKLFYVLSFDAPLRALFPSPLLSATEQLLSDILNGVEIQLKWYCNISKHYSPYIGSFVSAFMEDQVFDADAFAVLKYLIDTVNSFKESAVTALDPLASTGSYNPLRLGRAYYFTSSGQQLREARKFSIDEKNEKRGSHDDKPNTSKCSKHYPVVAKKGSSFMFLWFCPSHGHCYGFHVVNGSEGRKDPAHSLYTHLPVAPETIFYDFACSLEEYCMNRESKYYANTRFFHDIFHGYSHSCSPVYSSKSLVGLRGINTSICEQFNSYLRCIKASSKHMSQKHFMFFTQYMVEMWNRKKYDSFVRKLSVAASGAQ